MSLTIWTTRALETVTLHFHPWKTIQKWMRLFQAAVEWILKCKTPTFPLNRKVIIKDFTLNNQTIVLLGAEVKDFMVTAVPASPQYFVLDFFFLKAEGSNHKYSEQHIYLCCKRAGLNSLCSIHTTKKVVFMAPWGQSVLFRL